MNTTTNPGTAGERGATMLLTVDLSNTVGQESAIAANGGPVFTIKVTHPARELPPTFAGERQFDDGFGRVVSGGPVNGYEVLYRTTSVIAEGVAESAGWQHRDGLVIFG